MKFNNFKNNKKGSVLVAVIGVLAVLSIMALRFNAEMETAMLKTTSKGISSDVKTLADSALQYCIALTLKNGELTDTPPTMPAEVQHSQLAIEEQMEMKNYKDDKDDRVGTGVPKIIELYGRNSFYSTKAAELNSYIPDTINLAPGNVNFLIEDLSGKMPIGHVSQFYQRHMISTILLDQLIGKVPENQSSIIHSELYGETDPLTGENLYDFFNRYIYVRPLIPYGTASKIVSAVDHKNQAGIPLADGVHSIEDLGSSFTWIKSSGNSQFRKLATDIYRSPTDFNKLAGALTQYSRFIPDTKFNENATSPTKSSVSYASINPRVMYAQNTILYDSFFFYTPNDKRLKLAYSVSFPPAAGVATDDETDITNIQAAIAEDIFENGKPAYNFLKDFSITKGMPLVTVATTSTSYPGTSLYYNARNLAHDKHKLVTGITLSASVKQEDQKSWSDPDFTDVTKTETIYYAAMDKAMERLSRAFKGKKLHDWPAENVMPPIVTRKTLEFAIIKAVFGDSIMFAGKNKISSSDVMLDFAAKDEALDYDSIFYNLLVNNVDLKNVIFVDNALFKAGDTTMAQKYFVPTWEKTSLDLSSNAASKYGSNAGIKVPMMGLYNDSGTFVNYLPHPLTDQRGLHNYFVTIAAAYSVEKQSDLLDPPTTKGAAVNVPKMYEVADESQKVYRGRKMGGTEGDAYYNIATDLVVTPAPANDFIPLYDIKSSKFDADNKSHPALTSADFTPYETTVRMAVLVNLLNAIIPMKMVDTKNATDVNGTLFSTSLSVTPKNLYEFITFNDIDGYSIGASSYLNNSLPGGIQTPGMTFWKYGVNSTTFQYTIDAYKFDDTTRLSAVVTFDLYNDLSSKSEIGEDHNKHKYELTYALKKDVKSVLYLNPLGRAMTKADNFVLGRGEMRYPSDTNTDSWRVISYQWGDSYGRRSLATDDYFTPIQLYPEKVVNVGPSNGSWHYENHPMEPIPFDKFFMDINNISSTYKGSDYSKGTLNNRKYCFGKGSWLQWNAYFSKKEPPGSLTIIFEVTPGNANSGYAMNHEVSIMEKATGKIITTIPFTSVSTWGSSGVYSKTIPVATEKTDYIIRLTEMKDSDSGPYSGYSNGPELFKSITIFEK